MKVLEKYAPGFCRLTEEEQKVIHVFSVLWTLFEAQLLDECASAAKIKEKVKSWDVSDEFWKDHLNYFKQRYSGIEANEYFVKLNLHKSDDPELVEAVLKGERTKPQDTLAATLIIVLRFRNNYFHGLKWAYDLQGQKDNFEKSIDLIRLCLERFVK